MHVLVIVAVEVVALVQMGIIQCLMTVCQILTELFASRLVEVLRILVARLVEEIVVFPPRRRVRVHKYQDAIGII